MINRTKNNCFKVFIHGILLFSMLFIISCDNDIGDGSNCWSVIEYRFIVKNESLNDISVKAVYYGIEIKNIKPTTTSENSKQSDGIWRENNPFFGRVVISSDSSSKTYADGASIFKLISSGQNSTTATMLLVYKLIVTDEMLEQDQTSEGASASVID
ncbi:hypothetical protein FACS1894102_6440 [Spirochaetia bacterium]|nr:hypothetical protein FACS1894102_6440 [Spirochaetia bacterium]